MYFAIGESRDGELVVDERRLGVVGTGADGPGIVERDPRFWLSTRPLKSPWRMASVHTADVVVLACRSAISSQAAKKKVRFLPL